MATYDKQDQENRINKIGKFTQKAVLINKMNDTDIAKTYYNAEKCDAKYVSKLSVKAIVNAIRNISDLENVSTKIEKIVEKGIESVENFYKSGTGGWLNSSTRSYTHENDDKNGKKIYTEQRKTELESEFKKGCTMLRDAAKASQKVTSVGVKIATVAYKCLVPKTDQQKADYNSSVAAKEYEKKFNKTA